MRVVNWFKTHRGYYKYIATYFPNNIELYRDIRREGIYCGATKEAYRALDEVLVHVFYDGHSDEKTPIIHLGGRSLLVLGLLKEVETARRMSLASGLTKEQLKAIPMAKRYADLIGVVPLDVLDSSVKEEA